METINFTHTGRHTSTSGDAVIVESHSKGRDIANRHFMSNNDTRDVSIELLTIENVEEQDYKVYECYTDAGSDDYFYFAIPR